MPVGWLWVILPLSIDTAIKLSLYLNGKYLLATLYVCARYLILAEESQSNTHCSHGATTSTTTPRIFTLLSKRMGERQKR